MKEPKIRFKGFKGEWEEKKIGTMTSVRGGYAFQSSLFQKSGIPVVRISNILSNGNVGGDFAYYPRLDGDTNITIHEKDVVIAMSGATTGKIARVDVGDGILYQNQRVGLFTKTSKVDYDFLYAVLNRPHFNELLNKLLTSSAQPNASSADIESIEMGFPEDAEEQKALSNYILSLDSLIQSTIKKIESLKQVKAASLQSMFPQEGETTPRVRFKGFEGEWEKVSLADVGKCFSGICFPESEQGGDNGIPFYKVSDMNIVGNENVMTYSNNYVTDDQVKRNGWKVCNNIPAIFFAKVGAAVLLNRKRLTLKPCLCDNNTMLYSFDKSAWDTYFCLCCFEAIDLASLVQVGSLPSYNGSMIGAIKVFLPQYEEQQALGQYFQNLDRQITLQTQRLEKLKQIKSACLDNMFV